MNTSRKAVSPANMNLWQRLIKDEEGFAMEWILIVLLVAAALVGLLMVFSQSTRNMMLGIIGVTKANSVQEVKSAGEQLRTDQDSLNINDAKEAGQKLGGEGGNGGTSSDD